MGIVLSVNERSFTKEVIKCKIPVMVDFWSPTCIPCKRVSPILDKLAEEFDSDIKFVKVNVAYEETLSKRFNVMGLPTMIFFNKGKKIDELVGASGEKRMRRKIENIVGSLHAEILRSQRTKKETAQKYEKIQGLSAWIQ